MNNYKSVLKSRKGITMVELILSAALLCLAITLVSMVLSPTAEMIRRLDELDDAQIVADGLLETVRYELENAQGYIKFYSDGANIADETGADSGKAVEFKNADGYAILISAQGCEQTLLRRPDGDAGTADEVPAGYLLQRYYKYEPATNTYYCTNGATNIARALTTPYGVGYYMGYKSDLKFEHKPNDQVLVTVALYKTEPSEPTYSESLTVDLRYKPAKSVEITAKTG